MAEPNTLYLKSPQTNYTTPDFIVKKVLELIRYALVEERDGDVFGLDDDELLEKHQIATQALTMNPNMLIAQLNRDTDVALIKAHILLSRYVEPAKPLVEASE